MNRTRIAASVVLGLALIPSAWHAWNARGMPFLGNFNNDDGFYLVGAKSLAEGRSYRILSLPGEPYQTKYPPLYPALLAIVWRWNPHFPENLAALGVVAWLMIPLTVGAVSWLYRELEVGLWDRVALCAFLALHPLISLLGTHLLAELPFAALAWATLALAERASRQPDGYGRAALAGGVAGLAYLTKSAGIVFLLSAPAVFLWQRRRRAAAAFFLAMFPAVAGWGWWAAARRLAATDPLLLYYTDYLGFRFRTLSPGDVPLVVAKNVQMLAVSIGQLFLVNPEGPRWIEAVSVPLALVGLAGAVVWMRGICAFHCAAFGAGLSILLAAWHYPPTDRLALPLLPPAAAGLYFAGIRSVGAAGQFISAFGSLGKMVRRLAPAAIVSLVL